MPLVFGCGLWRLRDRHDLLVIGNGALRTGGVDCGYLGFSGLLGLWLDEGDHRSNHCCGGNPQCGGENDVSPCKASDAATEAQSGVAERSSRVPWTI